MNKDKLLDLIAVGFAMTCVIVVLATLLLCLPNGRWAIDANSVGEMYIEVILATVATPFTLWRMLRFIGGQETPRTQEQSVTE